NTKMNLEVLFKYDSIPNPTYVCTNAMQNRVYAVSETTKGKVYSLSLDRSFGFRPLNSVSTKGEDPCHVILDKTEKWLFASNYSGGSMSVFPILADGSIGGLHFTESFPGRGPHKGRQEKSHIHMVNISDDNTRVYVADLGTDKVYVYAFDAGSGQLVRQKDIDFSGGSGPRHIAFHPVLPYMYVVHELKNTVSSISLQDKKEVVLETISTLPPDYKGENYCAAIRLSANGEYVYVSNRILNTIARFSVNKSTGKLTLLDQTGTQGDFPRDFAMTPDEKYMFVLNQKTDNVCLLKNNEGILKYSQEFKVFPKPVCIKFLK
ncbi:MAG: lactonase family protein, partial [Leadbetterella sp.]